MLRINRKLFIETFIGTFIGIKMREIDKLNRGIQEKRKNYIQQLITEYNTNNVRKKSSKDCFEYVKINFNNNVFERMLSNAERQKIGTGINRYKTCLHSLERFEFYLNNNQIEI